MEVVHEFFHRDLEGLKQASVFKEPVGDLKYKNHKIRTQEYHHSTTKPRPPETGKQTQLSHSVLSCLNTCTSVFLLNKFPLQVVQEGFQI